ncbi:MAG TPA: TlpA disulfide reductase family protein [Bacillota bacterium]|nr:TlpA disulfide reductase family protein [Bacillota bacterium]
MKQKKLLVIGAIMFLLIVTIAGLNFSMGNAEVKSGAAVGNRVLDFELSDLDGKKVNLLEVVGKNQVTLVNFWATWCPPCRAEIPELNRFYQKYGKQKVALLAVNLQEEPPQVKSFIKKNRIDFPVLTDTAGKVAKLYNVYAIPTTLIIDGKGIIRHVIEGSTTLKVLDAKVQDVMKGQ